MARGAGKSLPHVERSRCATVCDRLMRDAQIVSEIEALDPLRREALASVGAAERLGAEGSATAWRPARPRAKEPR